MSGRLLDCPAARKIMPNGNAAVNQNAMPPRLHCDGGPTIVSKLRNLPGNLPDGPTSRNAS